MGAIYNVLTMPDLIKIGTETENGVEQIAFDATEWLAAWPEMRLSVWAQEPKTDVMYEAQTHRDGARIVWDVGAQDTRVSGYGAVLVMGETESGERKLSARARTYIRESGMNATADPPLAQQPWYQGAMAAAGQASADADRAEAAAARAEAAEEAVYAPSASATRVEGGVLVTVTDKIGTTSAVIRDGERGETGLAGTDGRDGADGKDGYTPVKGVDYFDGADGRDGADGKDGYTPVKGVDYFDGADGRDGADGKDAVIDATLTQAGQAADAAKTGEAIGELKDNLTYIGNVGFNLFDKTKIVKNTMFQSNTGILIDMPGYYTVFFPVNSANNLRIRCSQMPYRISLFDASKKFISQIEGGAYASSISDASYAGVTLENTVDADTLMIAYTQETGGAYSDKWADLFPDAPEYVPYGFFVDAKSVSVDAYNNSIDSLFDGLTPKNVIDRLSLIDGVVIATDEYLGVKTATFTGTEATKTHAQLEIPCIPCKAYVLEFLGMSNYVDYSADYTTGAMLIVEFFDNNGSIIGSKYNSYVLGYNRLGYHRYGFVSPFGAKTAKIRFTTRANTNMTVANVSFKRVESYPQKQRNGILYDGHLGMTFVAPKNTLASFELGKIAGFGTMITNINVTSDGVLVALHDDTIDATSNGSGNVRDYTYADLLNYDFGSWFNASYTGTTIPKFEEVVKYLSTCGIKLGVSLHENTLTNDELDEMCEIIKKYGQRECLVKSFSFSMLEHVYSVLGNSAEYMWDYNATSTSDIDRLIALGAERVALEFYSDSVNDTVIEYARSNGVDCSVYFGNDIAQVKALVNKGITRFTVDTFSDIVFPMD